jgi:hypothetical protein
MKTSIKFINHASVIISDNNTSVLSDPWYDGDAFHKGWNLLYETKYHDIEEFLNEVTHIWISHEHPDHFSISFFKKFAITLKKNSIKILFQKTKDRRVYNFLIAQGLEVLELDFNRKYNLSENFFITCIKDGFYDSGLFVESYDEKILNLNDCEVSTSKKAKEVMSICGEVDVLLTQFSFAAWKGGKKNKIWRNEAAKEKLKTISLQIETFKPKFIIPFASFVYFSNEDNFYLNDAVNRPDHIKKYLKVYASKIVIMSPNDILGGMNQSLNEDRALEFWQKKYDKIKSINLNQFSKIDIKSLQISFYEYCERIQKRNNILLIKIIRVLSPISAFKPVVVEITDLGLNIKFDYVNKFFLQTHEPAMISMKSESLNFIFKNSFGFDTLTVNACFEENKKGAFVQATKTLAIENLNNLGIKIEMKTLINFSIIKLFLSRLYRVAKKLDV